MPGNLLALIFVLICAVPAHFVGRQCAIQLGLKRDATILIGFWFAVTFAAFLSGGFMVYSIALIAIVAFAFFQRLAGLPLFIVLLFAVPATRTTFGGFESINRLIDLSNGRLLAIILLMPLLLLGRHRPLRGFSLPDWLVVLYALLSALLAARDASFTAFLRLTAESCLDILLPYFAFSRLTTNVNDVRKIFLSMLIAGLPLAMVAIFETLKAWRVYSIVAVQFGADYGLGYLTRDGTLRAGAIAGSPIILGLILLVVIGCALVFRNAARAQPYLQIAFGILVVGMIATLSRGPWVGAAFMLVVYVAFGPNAASNLGKMALAGLAMAMVLPLTPVGAKLIDYLPFVGSIEAGTVEFRGTLFENAMEIVMRNFWIGSTDYREQPELLELYDGFQRMVDIVNHYLKIALDTGVIGLTLFCSFFGSIVFQLWRALRMPSLYDEPVRPFLRAMLAVLVGILVTIATVSAIDHVPYVMWCSGGLGVALVRLARQERAVRVQAFRSHEAAV